MPSQMEGWAQSHLRLSVGIISLSITVWTVWRAVEPDRPIALVDSGARIGAPEYASMSVFLILTAAVAFVGWSRPFWPSVRFRALYGAIAACRDDVGGISQSLNPKLPKHPTVNAPEDVTKFGHRLEELQADLAQLRIELPVPDPGQDGAAHYHVELRRLTVLAHRGDIRGARELWKPGLPESPAS